MKARYPLTALSVIACLGLLPGQSPRAAAADAYKIDKVHSSIMFRIKHGDFGYVYGRFNDLGGNFTLDETNPANSTLEVEIKADSVDTNNADRDKHLKGADFFNAKEFPKITFKSKQVKALDNKNYEVTGDLTLHGVTKSVTAKVEFVGKGKDFKGTQRAGLETIFVIKRSDFGMDFGIKMNALGDEVRIALAVEGTRP